MALFGLSTNARTPSREMTPPAGTCGRAQVPANEANAAEQMQGGRAGMAQMASGIGGALSGALGGVSSHDLKPPATGDASGQGAMQPLMSNATGPRR